jgi:1-phosphofructokinase
MAEAANVSVFASALLLTVTIESVDGQGGEAGIHIHPGGQGFWVARMVHHLGERPILSAPIGGEIGVVLAALVPEWGVELAPTSTEAASPVYVHDRRDGDRREIAETPSPVLDRHELDNLYSKTLETALSAGICVVTARFGEGGVPHDFYRRLGSDLASTGVVVVGDLHGDDLSAFLEGGPIDVLKVSADDLKADAAITGSGQQEVLSAVAKLSDLGAKAVVVSGSDGATFATFEGSAYRATQPSLESVDHRGSGDSMTAALAVGLRRGFDPLDTIKLACAAGAANVVRHGLANADPNLIDRLKDLVTIEVLDQ